MKESKKTKFVTEHEVEDSDYKVKSPFKVSKDNRRRFIRVEISSPMHIQRIKGIDGGFWPEGQGQPLQGKILNISLGGVLVSLDDPLAEGDVVILHFNIQGEVSLRNVTGLIKRSEEAEGRHLTGIEFIARERLADRFSAAELDMLPDDLDGFDDNVRKVLRDFIGN